ncbi:hypothetical protein SAMN05192583_1588 [Sphingomonas gellani]|uniref:Uncharacterized protein n=1 Tax=Sphingomonas gellani TaxID=1166340 RepID=A0A1H8CHN7_9SPHN|nr:hypothetical protein [Sphingomonas gellani]SEM93778.1 hypothetical protein SAMN05192583_1588 [Sphingomonas gellani]
MLWYIYGFWIALAALFAAAYRFGGRTERQVATMYLAAAIGTLVLRPALAMRWRDVEPAILLVDVLLALGMMRLGIRSGKIWILTASALQILSSLAHLARAMDPTLWWFGYQLMEEAGSYPMLVLLAIGICQHHSRKQGQVVASAVPSRNDLSAWQAAPTPTEPRSG